MKQNTKKDYVVSLLKEGWVIYTRRNEHFGKKGQLVYNSLTYYICAPNGKQSKYIHHSTIQSLIRNKIIYGPYESFDKYTLINQ